MSEDAPTGQKKLYNLYALFGVSLALSVIPHVSAMVLCLVFFTWLLVASYVIRGKAEEFSLVHNHTTFIIRSLWTAVIISLVTTLAASAYMMGTISYEPFQPCANKIAGMGIEAFESMSYEDIYALTAPCLESFVDFNKHTLMIATGIAAVPPVLYIGYRFIKGVSRSVKDYRLAYPKNLI